MQTSTLQLPKLAISAAVVILTLSACGGSSNDMSTEDDAVSMPDEINPIDWTGRACEAPAFMDKLGTYTGELQYEDTSARSCRWSAEITIAGTSEADIESCNLTGTVKIALIEQGTQLEESPYACAEMDQTTGYATGLEEGLDINIVMSNSFQVQFDEPLTAVDENGLQLVYGVTQYESLYVGSDKITTANGVILKTN